MSNDIVTARAFVTTCELAAPSPVARMAKGMFDYDAAKAQAAVVGADIVAFMSGVPAECRQDIANASLLAQLVAKKQVPAPTTLASLTGWYDAYFDVLSRIGFAIQDKGFATYTESSESFEAHEAILQVAAALFAGAPGALAVIKSTLEALKSTADSTGWITLFNRESQATNTARFQVSLVGQETDGRLFVSIIAFGLEARTRLTQVLFLKFRSNDVRLEHHSGKVSINARLLAGVRDQLASKLTNYASGFIAGLNL